MSWTETTMKKVGAGLAAGSAALMLVLGATTGPAEAAGALHGHRHGYWLTFRGGQAKLVIPARAARHDKYVPFQVTCHRESIIAFAATRNGQRTFQGPYAGGVRAGDTCVISKRSHRVARFKVHH